VRASTIVQLACATSQLPSPSYGHGQNDATRSTDRTGAMTTRRIGVVVLYRRASASAGFVVGCRRPRLVGVVSSSSRRAYMCIGISTRSYFARKCRRTRDETKCWFFSA
jgi:hypothetical protein